MDRSLERPIDGGDLRWSKPEIACFAVFACGVLLSLFGLVHPWYDPTNDGSRYIATARSLLAGEGYSYLGMPHHLRFPGFTALITPVLALFGTNFLALNLYVSLFGAVGVMLVYTLFRQRLGWVLALAVSISIWLNPRYQQLCNQVMSDVPSTTLVLGCLLIERWSSRKPGWRRELLLGLAIGMTAYVRMANILLVPAILAARWFRRRAASAEGAPGLHSVVRYGAFALVTIAVIVPWTIRDAAIVTSGPADQGTHYSYSTGMFHRDAGDPSSPRLTTSELIARAISQVLQVSQGLTSRLQAGVHQPLGGPWRPPGFGSLLVLAGALLVLWTGREASDLYAMALIGVICCYLGYQDRLLLPVYVLLLPAATAAARDLGRALLGGAGAIGLPLAALLLLTSIDFHPRLDWMEIQRSHLEFSTRAREIESRLAPDAVLATTHGPHYEVYLNRPVFSLKHVVRRSGTMEAAEEMIDRYGINTVAFARTARADRKFIAYFRENHLDVSESGSIVVFRVRP